MWDYFLFYGVIWYSTPNGYTVIALLRQETLMLIMIIMGDYDSPNRKYIHYPPIFKGYTLHKCCDLV